MTGEIKLVWDDERGRADIAIENNDLVLEDGLETSVIISLFTDRRVPFGQSAPDTGERRGWWADGLGEIADNWGSRLWTLETRPLTSDTMRDAETYCLEALQWMIDDGIAGEVNVTVTRSGQNTLSIGVEIVKPSYGEPETDRYHYIWHQQLQGVA